MSTSLTEALKDLSPDAVNRKAWETVGIALKTEGYPREAWEEWTRGGSEHDPAECAAMWTEFYPEGNYIPLTIDEQIPGRRSLLRLVDLMGLPKRQQEPLPEKCQDGPAGDGPSAEITGPAIAKPQAEAATFVKKSLPAA